MIMDGSKMEWIISLKKFINLRLKADAIYYLSVHVNFYFCNMNFHFTCIKKINHKIVGKSF